MVGKCSICGKLTIGSFKTGLCRHCFVTVGNPFRRQEVIEKVKKHQKGKTNSNWKGGNVSYGGLHIWMNRNWGRPKYCDYCGILTAKRNDWANITGSYDREKENYRRLCRGCHIRLDRYHSIEVS